MFSFLYAAFSFSTNIINFSDKLFSFSLCSSVVINSWPLTGLHTDLLYFILSINLLITSNKSLSKPIFILVFDSCSSTKTVIIRPPQIFHSFLVLAKYFINLVIFLNLLSYKRFFS